MNNAVFTKIMWAQSVGTCHKSSLCYAAVYVALWSVMECFMTCKIMS